MPVDMQNNEGRNLMATFSQLRNTRCSHVIGVSIVSFVCMCVFCVCKLPCGHPAVM